MLLLFKGHAVRAYVREISEYNVAQKKGGKREKEVEEINEELQYEEEGVMGSVTLRHVLLTCSSLILCMMSEGDL